MGALVEIKSYMEWWGWSNGGNPGSVKRVDGLVVAHHGDEVWESDVQKACDTLQRIAARAAGYPYCVFCKRHHEGGDTCMGHYP